MRFEGVCYPHPQIKVEVSSFDLEYILDCLDAEDRSNRKPQARRLANEIHEILKRVKKER